MKPWALLKTVGLGRAGFAIGLTAALFGLSGFYAGAQWQRGVQAIAERSALKTEVAGLRKAAGELQRYGIAIAQDYRTAATRMEALRDDYESYVHELDQQQVAQQKALDDFLATRPDLAGCHLGADGVRLWNASAAGVAATTATTGYSGRVAGAVPGDAADAEHGERRDGGRAAGLVTGKQPIPPLPSATTETRTGGGRL